MEILKLKGHEARAFAQELAGLRLKVFYEFPYLYEGTLAYEMKYLETYFQAKSSFIVLIKDQDRVIGATTSIRASEEEESFKRPFQEAGMDINTIFYFGESILLPEYRGQGIGKLFFQEREAFARTLPEVHTLAFCAVVRDENHPLKPSDYKPLYPFWQSQGFLPRPGLTTQYEWQDRNEDQPSSKPMQFWIKNI